MSGVNTPTVASPEHAQTAELSTQSAPGASEKKTFGRRERQRQNRALKRKAARQSEVERLAKLKEESQDAPAPAPAPVSEAQAESSNGDAASSVSGPMSNNPTQTRRNKMRKMRQQRKRRGLEVEVTANTAASQLSCVPPNHSWISTEEVSEADSTSHQFLKSVSNPALSRPTTPNRPLSPTYSHQPYSWEQPLSARSSQRSAGSVGSACMFHTMLASPQASSSHGSMPLPWTGPETQQ